MAAAAERNFLRRREQPGLWLHSSRDFSRTRRTRVRKTQRSAWSTEAALLFSVGFDHERSFGACKTNFCSASATSESDVARPTSEATRYRPLRDAMS